MTVAAEQFGRAVPGVDPRSWLTWGTGVFAAVEIVHVGAGTLINGWEGWSVFAGNVVFVAVSGLAIVGLVFGLLVRWALEPSPRGRNRSALTALAVAALSIAGYAIFFTWAPLLVAPGAVLLARAGLARRTGGGRVPAAAGALLALASFAFGVAIVAYALAFGDYPFDFAG